MFKHVINIEKFPGENIMYTGDLDSCEYTNCVGLLGIVPPQGCEAILIEILQPKRSTAGPHFIPCLLINKDTYNKSRYTIENLISIRFVTQVLFGITNYHMFYCQFSSQLCYGRD